jgi:hypothetical protein
LQQQAHCQVRVQCDWQASPLVSQSLVQHVSATSAAEMHSQALHVLKVVLQLLKQQLSAGAQWLSSVWLTAAGLVKLLEAHSISSPPPRTTSSTGEWAPATAARAGSGGVARRAADAITNLAHENIEIKNMVRCSTGLLVLW